MAALGAATVVCGLVVAPPAQAADNATLGYPVFTGDPNPVPSTGVAYTAGNQLQKIFDADLAAGAGSSPAKDFWIDKMLARTGTAGSFGDENQWLFTRGRAAFMKEHTPGTLGFGGKLAYWESIDGRDGYAITAQVNGADVTLTEDTTRRKQTPSYWQSVHRNTASGIEVTQTKYITDANVLVTNLAVTATGGARNVTLRASSPYATSVEGDELVGTVEALNKLTNVFPRFSGDGFTAADGVLTRTLDVPAGGTVTAKMQMGLLTEEIPEARTEYDAYRAATPEAAFTTHVRAYNQWWADNVPYLDTPEDNIDKTLFYRWWLMRFNFLDANIPGNDYQFPTSMEGVLGYNNNIVLTTGMFIDDLKYFRDPIYSYGPWVTSGEESKSYKYVDNPGDPANWSNSYTEYISEAAWRSYQLHGGPTAIAGNLAKYAEYDVKGLIDAYDFNKNGLIEYSWGSMTGNDADAVSFDWKPGQNMDRAENAYLYSNALAAANAYRLTGNTAKADEMEAFAANIKKQIMSLLWNKDSNLIEHRGADGQLVPWKEINNYYPFAVGLVPKPGDADYADDYLDSLRLWKDADEYPIFPFFVANQADKKEALAAGFVGSNNFSVISSTVMFRIFNSVIRNYKTDAITAESYKKLLYWNAWSHYQNGGDNRLPDQNEFWADASADPQKIGYRSWIHHTILGATNFTMIEDTMGLRPRSDAKIELDPINIDWDHFTANNIRYRDKDLTVTWDEPGGERYYGNDVPEGYSVFLDGQLAFTVDKLGKVVYDPATGTIEAADGVTVTTANKTSVKAPQDVTFGNNARVVDLFAKAGADVSDQSAGSTNIAQGKPVSATFSAAGRAPEGAVNGTTINEPFWGTAGSPNARDSITIELGSEQKFDNARVYFYNSSSTATVQGYSEPSTYLLEYRSGGEWKTVPSQARTPQVPRANLNQVQFPEVTGDAVRVTAVHAPGMRTGVKEVQLFHTGVAAPAATNVAPEVSAWIKPGTTIPGEATLVGSVKDDGLPSGTLSSEWSVVSAPEGGVAVFENAAAPSTVARFTTAGDYVLRLTASDGERTTTTDLPVRGVTVSAGNNIAPSATPTAEFTGGYWSVKPINDGDILYTGGTTSQWWGSWAGQPRPATRWLQYEWQEPVRVDKSSFAFFYDTTNVASGEDTPMPKAWKIQYWTGTEWKDVKNTTPYPVDRDKLNEVRFEPVTTTKLRAVLTASNNGTQNASLGVSEWQVFAESPRSIDPVDVRTAVGKLPTLPEQVEAIYADGTRSLRSVSWAPVSEDKVATEGSFTVTGVVPGSSVPASVTVWVRATAPGQVNQVDAVSISTRRGVAPALPAKVSVLYNDGSREDLPVTWNAVNPADYAVDNEFTVTGTVQTTLTGNKTATATITVGDSGGPDTSAPTATVTPSPETPASGWYTGEVTVTASAEDNRDESPSIEIAVDGGSWAAYTAPVKVTGDGNHTVQARATDEANNVSPIAESTFKIDATAPAITPNADATARTVKPTATDTGSGVDRIEYRIGDAAEWTAYTRTIPVGLMETTVHLRAADKAGNVSADAPIVIPAADGTQNRNLALSATPTASYTAPWNRVTGLNDDVTPTKSANGEVSENVNVWGTWPQVTDQWVQYDWAEPVKIGGTSAYFGQDIDPAGDGLAVPKEWKAQYRDGSGNWVDVIATSPYGVAVDTFNKVTFQPVTTTGLRLALKAQGTVSGKGALSIKEWQVSESVDAPAAAFKVETATTYRCVAGKAVMVASFTNKGTTPVTIAVTSPFGSKTFTTVKPGATVSAAFTTRQVSVAAGKLSVAVTGDVNGASKTEKQEVAYTAFTC